MNRKEFLGIAGISILMVAKPPAILTDKNTSGDTGLKIDSKRKILNKLNEIEIEILTLASLAPSGHNAQPWFVKYIEPYKWIIGNDKTKWLPAVDPMQRETILSIGAFIQNLGFAANHFGYECQFQQMANTNQDENIVEVKFKKTTSIVDFDINKIKLRRTLRSHNLKDPISTADVDFLTHGEKDFLHFIPTTTKEYTWLNEQTIEAGTIQTNRNNAQQELSN